MYTRGVYVYTALYSPIHIDRYGGRLTSTHWSSLRFPTTPSWSEHNSLPVRDTHFIRTAYLYIQYASRGGQGVRCTHKLLVHTVYIYMYGVSHREG